MPPFATNQCHNALNLKSDFFLDFYQPWKFEVLLMPQMESPPLQDSDESPIEDDIEQLFRGVVKHLCLTLHHSLLL